MDTGSIVALSGLAITMVGSIFAMMFWCRGEANLLRAEAKEDRRDLMQISRNLENAVEAIKNEMKDFHYRLLEIERNRK